MAYFQQLFWELFLELESITVKSGLSWSQFISRSRSRCWSRSRCHWNWYQTPQMWLFYMNCSCNYLLAYHSRKYIIWITLVFIHFARHSFLTLKGQPGCEGNRGDCGKYFLTVVARWNSIGTTIDVPDIFPPSGNVKSKQIVPGPTFPAPEWTPHGMQINHPSLINHLRVVLRSSLRYNHRWVALVGERD